MIDKDYVLLLACLGVGVLVVVGWAVLYFLWLGTTLIIAKSIEDVERHLSKGG